MSSVKIILFVSLAFIFGIGSTQTIYDVYYKYFFSPFYSAPYPLDQLLTLFGQKLQDFIEDFALLVLFNKKFGDLTVPIYDNTLRTNQSYDCNPSYLDDEAQNSPPKCQAYCKSQNYSFSTCESARFRNAPFFPYAPFFIVPITRSCNNDYNCGGNTVNYIFGTKACQNKCKQTDPNSFATCSSAYFLTNGTFGKCPCLNFNNCVTQYGNGTNLPGPNSS